MADKKLTRAKALQVLIKHAAADCAGAGTGIRTITVEAERRLVKEAVLKFYREAFGHEPDQSALFNLRME